MEILERLKRECIEAQAVSPNFYAGDKFIAWEDVEAAAELYNNKLKKIQQWAHIIVNTSREEWTECDERIYRDIFGVPLTKLLEEEE
ncbi:hypothetical protein [Enterococcus sp. N249-2]